jgi:Acetyltransferase (GNAT) family
MKIEMLNTPSQGVDIEELAQLHHDEFGEGRQFDVRAVTRAVVQCILDDRRKYINAWIGYDDGGKPIGYIVGTIRPSLYNMSDIATQEMWFVVPEHRTGLVAVQLVWHMEKWAKSHNVERIYLQVEHDDKPELVERIINVIGRLGYRKQGYIAVKHLFNRAKDKSDDRSTHSELVANTAH